MPERALLRSYLYAPGSRPEVMEKALGAGADAVVLDLEDAVAPSEKVGARHAVGELIARRGPVHDGDPARTTIHVRINRTPAGPECDDVAAVLRPGLAALRIPKAGSDADLRDLAARLDELEFEAGMQAGSVAVYPIVESAAGVAAARELAAAPRVARLVFGATDFLADIGAPGDPDGPATLYARGALVLASRLAGIDAPIDSVHTALDDEAGLRRGAESARALGFFGKSVIHPRQLAIVHEIFTPSAAELQRARQVLAAGAGSGGGGSTLDGEFVDPAVVARARATLALVGEVDR